MTGRMLAFYRLAEKLGEGGMGVVYQAEDTRLGRTVAVKVLAPEKVVDAKYRARFLQEARVASLLNHPNIAVIHDVGEVDGLCYIAMELVEGETLKRRIGGHSMKTGVLLDLGLQIAEAIAEAHSRGVVHRDIKTGNILVTPQGRVKILDFGLAKRLAAPSDATLTLAENMTETGIVMGTVSYMSPEQALGHAVDERSDLFSLGVVLHEMASGRLPFPGDSATSVIDKILHAAPPPLREVPPALEDVLAKLLEKAPEDRYQSARELVVDLRRLKKACDLGKLQNARAPAGRAGEIRRRLPLFAALTALAFAGGLAVHRYWMAGGAGTAGGAPLFTAITRFAGVEAQPSLSPDGRSIVFVSDRGGQRDLWVGLINGGNLLQITSDPNAEVRPRWSPDGSRIVYARLNEGGTFDIWMVPALGGTARKLVPDASDPAWSADGRTLAYVNLESNSLWACDANGGHGRALMKAQANFFPRQPAFSHDGKRVAFEWRRTGPRGELGILEIGTQEIRTLTNDGMLALSPAWTPDDRFLYFASSRTGAMNIWKIASHGGQPRQVTTGQGDDAELDLSPDGKRLVFSTYRVNVDLAEVRLDAAEAVKPAIPRTAVKWLTRDATRSEIAPVYSPQAGKIAYFSNRRGTEAETMWTIEADGASAAPMLEDGQVNVYPRWTADGQSVICMTRERFPPFELRRVPLSGAPPEILARSEAFSIPWGDVAVDGRLAYGEANGKTHILDLKNRQSRELEAVRGSHLRWSRDGGLLAYSVRPGRAGDPNAGAWVYDFQNPPRQVFKGWVLWQEWMRSGELLVAQGRPDLTARMWRVHRDGRAAESGIILPTYYSYYVQMMWILMFDVHPDGRRIVAPQLESHEADIGMIENAP